MKKFFKKISGIILAFFMAFTLMGCDKSGSIKSAFESKDYTISTMKVSEISKWIPGLDDEQREYLDKCEIFSATSGLNMAIVIKFPSFGAVKDFYTVETEDGKKDSSAYTDLKDKGYINGNCVLLMASSQSASDIFKKA